jgi:hypothetical protein
MLFPESNSQRDVGNISKITDNKCNYQNAHSIPGSPSHPTACIAQVYESAWWMMLYGSITPKRHIAWSNARTVKVLDLSRLLREVKERMSSKVRKSSKTYRNRRGGMLAHATYVLHRYLKQRTNMLYMLMFFW